MIYIVLSRGNLENMMKFRTPLMMNGENDMDEDSGSPHLFISKTLIKNRFEKKIA
jgi:hypothetical protein